jgi:hypothetical protein
MFPFFSHLPSQHDPPPFPHRIAVAWYENTTGHASTQLIAHKNMASFLAGLDAVEVVVPCSEDDIVRRIGQSSGGPTYAGLMVPNEWKYVIKRRK